MYIKNEDVAERLTSLGYNVDDSDMLLIQYATNGTEQYIMNFCNISEIPTELYYVAVDMVAGTLLKTRQSMGMPIWEDIDLNDEHISSITEGDISISYKYDSDESTIARFNKLVESLCNRDKELIGFRKIRW